MMKFLRKEFGSIYQKVIFSNHHLTIMIVPFGNTAMKV